MFWYLFFGGFLLTLLVLLLAPLKLRLNSSKNEYYISFAWVLKVTAGFLEDDIEVGFRLFGFGKNTTLLTQLASAKRKKSVPEKVVSSVQHLEYAFTSAFNSVIKPKQKKVAVIKGNGELNDYLMGDFIKQVKENCFIGTFTLDSVAKTPVQTLKQLKKYDLAIIAKPTEAFSDEEKQVLDQFVITGGKTIWLIDQVNMEMDSLYNQSGSNLAFSRDLNLNDMFFKYGIRIRPDLIFDLQNTPIALATGESGRVGVSN